VRSYHAAEVPDWPTGIALGIGGPAGVYRRRPSAPRRSPWPRRRPGR